MVALGAYPRHFITLKSFLMEKGSFVDFQKSLKADNKPVYILGWSTKDAAGQTLVNTAGNKIAKLILSTGVEVTLNLSKDDPAKPLVVEHSGRPALASYARISDRTGYVYDEALSTATVSGPKVVDLKALFAE